MPFEPHCNETRMYFYYREIEVALKISQKWKSSNGSPQMEGKLGPNHSSYRLDSNGANDTQI